MKTFAAIKDKVLALVFLEEHTGWVLFGLSALAVAMAEAAHIVAQMSVVRPLLVLVYVYGELPPICGFCVIFGSRMLGMQ